MTSEIKKRVNRAERKLKELVKHGGTKISHKELVALRKDVNILKADLGVLWDTTDELDARVADLEEKECNDCSGNSRGKSQTL